MSSLNRWREPEVALRHCAKTCRHLNTRVTLPSHVAITSATTKAHARVAVAVPVVQPHCLASSIGGVQQASHHRLRVELGGGCDVRGSAAELVRHAHDKGVFSGDEGGYRAASPGCSDVQWRVSVDVCGARVGAVIQQHLGGSVVAMYRAYVEGGAEFPVRKLEVLHVGADKSVDGGGVAAGLASVVQDEYGVESFDGSFLEHGGVLWGKAHGVFGFEAGAAEFF